MTKEEFIKRSKEDKEWAPGWDVIENEFSKLYSGQEPNHYGTNIVKRAILGGERNKWGYDIWRNIVYSACRSYRGRDKCYIRG